MRLIVSVQLKIVIEATRGTILARVGLVAFVCLHVCINPINQERPLMVRLIRAPGAPTTVGIRSGSFTGAVRVWQI